MKELLTESEWVQLFQKANFRRVTIAGGGTIAETISSYIEEPNGMYHNLFRMSYMRHGCNMKMYDLCINIF